MAICGVMLFGALLRFVNLGSPKTLVFDEVYYVDGARDYLQYGVEMKASKPEFIVHPPMGKWAIATGMKIFGDNPFGWRFSAALAGTLSILLVFLVARKLFHSFELGLLAATLMSFDGLHLVMSRTSLLDIFLMFFLLLAFTLFLYDKHWLTAISLGLALGTKWNAFYFIAALMIYLAFTKWRALLKYILAIPLTYLATWSGWLVTTTGWKRDATSNRLLSLFRYHQEILHFHTNLTTEHAYQANPWNWLILGRPTSFFYETPKNCGAASCSQEILALGTPFLWWSGTVAIFVTLGYFIYRRERSALLILLGLGSNLLPWFLFQERTMFFFYAITCEPFLILALVYMAQQGLQSASDRPQLLRQRRFLTYGGTALIGLCFLYFLPIFIGLAIPYDSWLHRMWLPSWI
ncbi:MAG: hypothetical protein RLZZ251_669 [Actinomycetota bacterium]